MGKIYKNLVPMVLTLLLLPCCLPTVSLAQTQAAPTVKMDPLNPSNVTVQPTHNNQVLYFKTELIVDKPPVGKMDFQITVDAGDGWATTVEPTMISFTTSGARFINATLQVPYDAKASSYNDIGIQALSMYMGTQYEARAVAIIKIATHLELRVKTSPEKSDHNPQVFKLDLTNYSNLDCTYSLEVMGIDTLVKHGIHAQLDKDETSILAPYHNETINMTVGYDTWASEGQTPIEVRIVTRSSDGTELKAESTSVTIVVNQIERNIPNLMILGIVIIVIIVVAMLVIHRVNKKRKKDRKSKKKAPKKDKGPIKAPR